MSDGMEPIKQNALDLAILEFSSRLPAYFRRRVPDDATAEDLAQETLLKAYRARDALRDHLRVEAWLYQIAHATVVDYYRRKPVIVDPCREVPVEDCRDRDRVRTVIIETVQCWLETLPRRYRDPVHLADYEGLPHIEVARELGLSLAAAKSRIRRGKLMVRRLVEARCLFEYDALGNIIGYQARTSPACFSPA